MDVKIIIALITAITSLVLSTITIVFNSKRIRNEKYESFKKEHYLKITDAYLEFWGVFKHLSLRHVHKDSVFQENNDEWNVIKKNVETFITVFFDFFYSKNGIYLSRDIRQTIFTLVDELKKITEDSKTNEIKISNSKFKKLKNLRDKAITQTRNQIGLRDINLPTEHLELIDNIK